MIIVNIPYLTLAAAHQLKIPCIAFSSLNLTEIYRYYFGHCPESSDILKQMLNAYTRAACFLQATPAMKMPGIENLLTIGPLAQVGQDVSGEVRAKLGIESSKFLVLVSLGEMELKTACEDWARFSGLHFVVPESWNSWHPDTSAFKSQEYSFVDLLRSSDVLIAKPGYGSFVEAGCSGTLVLYFPRQDWPETPTLIDWLTQQGSCKEVSRKAFETGHLEGHVRHVMKKGSYKPVAPTGIQEAVTKFFEYL